MKSDNWKKLVEPFTVGFLFLAMLLFFGCSSKMAPESKKGMKINELTAIKVDESGKETKIVISAVAELSPNVFKLTDPLRVIIDLTDTKLGGVKGPIEVNNGVVNEITTSQFDDVTSSLSRVVIGFDRVVEYTVETKDNALTIAVPKITAAETETKEGETIPSPPEPFFEEEIGAVPGAGEEASVEEPSLAESMPEVEEKLPSEEGAEALEAPEVLEVSPEPSEEAPVVVEEPAGEKPGIATMIEDIQFETSDMGTTVYVTANGEIGEWDDFVLERPTRLVLDLKDIQSAFKGRKRIEIGSNEVQQLRIGEYRDKVRIVMDYPEDKKPSYTINKENNRLVLNIFPASEPVAEAQEAPAEEAPFEEPPFEEAFEKELPVEEIPSEEAKEPVDEFAAEEAFEEAPEVAEEIPEVSPAEEIPYEEEPPTYAPEPTPEVAMTSVDFKQVMEEGKSRLVIGTSAPATYSIREADERTIVLELSNTNIPNTSLRRFLDTSAFSSPVSMITPKYVKSENISTITIKLKEPVLYRAYQEGSLVYVDFNIPDYMLAKATPAEAEKAPVREEAPVEAEALEEGLSEEMEPSTEDKQRWTPVKEEFLSDRLASKTPLSAMGGVLAETYGGQRRFVGRRISLDFKNAELKSIFRLLAEVSKFNMIIGDDVSGRITVRLENVPWDQAFAIILQTKGLWFERYGNIIRIAPAEKLKKERELAIARQRAMVESKPIDVLFKPISYATAGGIAARVKPVLSSRGTVDIDSRTNTLIIRDVKEHLEAAKSLIEKLDTQTPQVSIEARIVEANVRSRKGWGIRWLGNVRFTPATGNPTGLYFPNSVDVNNIVMNYPSPVGSNAAAGIRLGSINNVVDLDLNIELMESSGDGKLISSPKVTVLDNSSATIMSGTKIPYVTQTSNSGSNVRFENAVISLTVTPHVTADGSVFMKINATRNEPDRSIVIENNPAILQRVINTEVLVKSGNTTVLGGIYKINKEKNRESFPFLSKIPLIGYLFRNWGRDVNKEELLIFITPRIVGDERVAIRDIRG